MASNYATSIYRETGNKKMVFKSDAVLQFGTGVATPAKLQGGGTNASPVTTTTAGNFIDYRAKTTVASGSTRLRYERLYLGADAAATPIGDGECSRVFTTINGQATGQGIHGEHVSLSFGANGSNTGESAAGRHTLQVPNGVLGVGTYAATIHELFGEGANTDALSATEIAFARMVQSGTFKSGKDAIIDLFSVEGVSEGAGNVFRAAAPGAAAASLRVKVNGTPYYISLSAAQS